MTPGASLDAVAAFREAMRSRGIVPPADLIADGRIHRCDAEGKNGKGDAAYVLHLDGVPAGGLQNHRDGLGWFNWRAPLRRRLTASEQAQHRARLEAIRRERDADEARRRKEAAERAAAIWRAAKPAAADHPYLVRKAVGPHGVRQHEGRLVIPMRADGELVSLQFIGADGEKRFLPDGRTKGAYFAIGKPADVICIAEGYATGASIHEATGYAVAVAFNAGNLLPVAQALRARFPELRLILCADDDRGTEGNPGLAAATLAAKAIGGVVAIPDFGPDRPANAKDFNDLARLRGADAVREAIAHGAPPTTESTPRVGEDTTPHVELLCARDVKIEPVRWLWEGWLAAGKLHILAGAPGTGKTTIALALAATVTTGGRWPDGTRAERGDALIWSGEDDPTDTLAPRLMAAGADLARVQFVRSVRDHDGARPFDPATDMAALTAAARRLPDLRLLILDPIVNAVGADSHKNVEVRRALAPVVDLAESLRVAAFGISHFSKNTAGRDPVERVTGSLAFGALPRVVLAAAKIKNDDGTDGRLLARAKNNLGPDSGGFAYSLELAEIGGGISASRVLWGGAVEGTARELLADADAEAGGEQRDAADWLRERLADGPVDSNEVKRDGEASGISWATLRRAKKRIGAESSKNGMTGGWYWYLPKVLKGAEDAHPKKVSTFGEREHLRGAGAEDAEDAQGEHLRGAGDAEVF